MINAKQALELSRQSDPVQAVEAICDRIKTAASEGKYKIAVRDFGFGSNACYTEERKWPAKNQTIVTTMRELGFKCGVMTKDGSIAVDLWLEISWSD